MVKIAFASLYLIIITGSLVRLTGSGLGCADWPRCSESKFIDVSSTHAAIEQVNRLFTGVVAFSVVVATLLSLAIRPKRRDLVVISFGLVVGVLIQVILGGVVVLTGLNPFSNIAHFLVSIVLMTNVYILWQHAKVIETSAQEIPIQGMPARRRTPALTSQLTIILVRAIVVLTGLAIITGTVVTGSGPHAGDENAVRIGLAINTVVRIHSSAVIILLGLTIILFFYASKREQIWRILASDLERFLAVALVQGLIGYVQYFSRIPVLLVAVHVALSVAVWLSALSLAWKTKLPEPAPIVLDL
ncbi:MAG: COX15/CtaA family protein [Acidimicrobiaceae bacterium]|nr:COX15/CtaA family protein [Acidimicrobiaceae bacterium]